MLSWMYIDSCTYPSCQVRGDNADCFNILSFFTRFLIEKILSLFMPNYEHCILGVGKETITYSCSMNT
jgi:hypothetical protein